MRGSYQLCNSKMETDIERRIDKKGRRYIVRKDRRRFFFPDEWNEFLKQLKEDKKPLLDFMLNTGARIDEALHIRPCDFDFERNNARLWKTKAKAKKGETTGKPRTISLSSGFAKRMKKWCSNFKNEEYIFIGSVQSVNQLMKRALKKTAIKDGYNFSTHNIRKTHGMYLKALGIDVGEICIRLGHDHDTYIQHYGSADVFSEKDMRLIKELLGDLYMRQRRY